MFVNLVEENLSGVRVVDGFNMIGKNLLAAAWEVDVEVDVMMDDAGVG